MRVMVSMPIWEALTAVAGFGQQCRHLA